MTRRRCGTPIGPMLDALGVRLHLNDGQHLVEAMVVGKVMDLHAEPHQATSMVIGTSEGLDWIEQRGLLSSAQDVLVADLLRATDE